MQDVVFVVLVVSFFVLAGGAVRLCDRVVGVAAPQDEVAMASDEVKAA